MNTLKEMFDYLHYWDSFEPVRWQHSLGLALMRNMRNNLSHFYLQLDTTDEFERKIRLRQCQHMLSTLKSFSLTYDIDSDLDMKLFHNKMIQVVNAMIVKYCKTPSL